MLLPRKKFNYSYNKLPPQALSFWNFRYMQSNIANAQIICTNTHINLSAGNKLDLPPGEME